MSSPFERNFSALDMNRSVKGLYPAIDMPEYPARILIAHCAMKGLQWSVLGFVVAPVYSLTRRVPLRDSLRPVFVSLPAIGMVSTFGMLFYKAAFDGMDNEGVDDRAYRIAKSASQVHVDTISAIGGLVGATTGAIFGKYALRSVLSTASIGVGLGVIIHSLPLLQNAVEEGKKKYMQ